MPELYETLRPRLWKHLFGQEEAVTTLRGFLERNHGVPSAILLSGPSGTGKTSAAYIMAAKMKCARNDWKEINVASDRGIDTIRELDIRIKYRPSSGPVRIWLLDEVQQMTHQAQGSLLKVLERSPSYAYFFLATTDPNKLIKGIHTRCNHVYFRAVPATEMEVIIKRTAKHLKTELSEDVIDKIIEVSEGSPRKAIKIVDQIHFRPAKKRLNAIQRSGTMKQAWDLVQALLWKRISWNDVAKILKDIKESAEDPERLRRLILANATNDLLKAKEKWRMERAWFILCEFEKPTYEFSGIATGTYAVFRGK